MFILRKKVYGQLALERKIWELIWVIKTSAPVCNKSDNHFKRTQAFSSHILLYLCISWKFINCLPCGKNQLKTGKKIVWFHPTTYSIKIKLFPMHTICCDNCYFNGEKNVIHIFQLPCLQFCC